MVVTRDGGPVEAEEAHEYATATLTTEASPPSASSRVSRWSPEN